MRLTVAKDQIDPRISKILEELSTFPLQTWMYVRQALDKMTDKYDHPLIQEFKKAGYTNIDCDKSMPGRQVYIVAHNPKNSYGLRAQIQANSQIISLNINGSYVYGANSLKEVLDFADNIPNLIKNYKKALEARGYTIDTKTTQDLFSLLPIRASVVMSSGYWIWQSQIHQDLEWLVPYGQDDVFDWNFIPRNLKPVAIIKEHLVDDPATLCIPNTDIYIAFSRCQPHIGSRDCVIKDDLVYLTSYDPGHSNSRMRGTQRITSISFKPPEGFIKRLQKRIKKLGDPDIKGT